MKAGLSFQGWILGGCLLVVLCTLIFVAIVFQHSLRHRLMDSQARTLGGELALVGELLGEQVPQARDRAALEALTNHLGQRLGLWVTLAAVDGVVLGDSLEAPSTPGAIQNIAERPEIQAVLETGQGHSQGAGPGGRPYLFVAGLWNPPEGAPLVIRLGAPMDMVEETLASTGRLIMGAVLLGACLSLGAAYLAARAISRPLKHIAQTATELAEGHLDRRLRSLPGHEVGELGQAFNSMAESLENQIQAVTSTRDRLEATLRGMVEGVLVTDAEGRILVANRAARLLLSLGPDPVGSDLSDLVRNHDLLEAINQARQVPEQTHVTGEMRLLGPPRRYLEISVVRLAGQGALAGCVAVLHDITAMRTTEQVRRDFVANVSHELRTPLTAIRGSAETLLDGALDSPPDARRFTEMIHRQAERLTRLVQDLLDLASIESGELALATKELNASAMAEAVLAMVSDLAKNRKITLKNQLPPKAITVKGDRRWLEQALLNLLDNAIKYTEPGGEVRLTAFTRPGEVVIQVADSGMGIAKEHLPRIFERFYRVDRNRSREMGGTGLGLAIVKHLMQAHGGRVEVESAYGQGTTFRLVLPA